MRVLVIEDEVQLREMVAARLRDEGYAVDAIADGDEGLFYAVEYPIDLAVIDLGLPGKPGLDVIRELRTAEKRYPVLILTARDRWNEKVEGLEAGADDYLTKPFHMEELIARVHALLRRSAGHAAPEVSFGPLTMNLSSQDVTLDGTTISLTSFEYRLLEYFALHPGQVVSKMELNEHLYDEDADPDSNVIEVLIGRLRKKLDPEGKWQPIETLRGRGYRFVGE